MVGRHSTAPLSNIMSEDNQEQSRIITMREVDLRNVILTLIRNMTKVNKDNVIDKKAEDIEAVSVSVPQNLNLTISEDLSDEDSDLALLMYLALFFLWYGAIIYGCLIGCGIYNKRRRTVTLYQAFVERTDLREQLRKRKEELRERRRHQRSHLPLQSIGGFHITQLVSSPRVKKNSLSSMFDPSSRRASHYDVPNGDRRDKFPVFSDNEINISDGEVNYGL